MFGNDICRCTSEKCPVRNECLRFTDREYVSGFVSFADFYEESKRSGEGCGYKIEEKK